MKLSRRTAGLTLALLAASFLGAAVAHAETRDIFFPTDPSATFRDDFGEKRAGHSHDGNDLIGKKMMPLYAAVDGYVEYLVIPEAYWGYAIVLRDADNYTYHYLHINNDTPGTDDGNGGPENAYAPGIREGALVTRGQLVGWMGDSGNAENVGPHLHFELRLPGGTPISPYASLIQSLYHGSYSASAAMDASPDINKDKGLFADTTVTPPCVSGSRIKTAKSKAVYYCGADGRRYVFPNDKAYYTWYPNFNGVITVTDEQLAAMRIGGNVTYRPGVRMVKIQSDPKVYVVDTGGTLRWVVTPETATAIYGADWAKKVDDVSDAFFVNYKIGEDVTSAR